MSNLPDITGNNPPESSDREPGPSDRRVNNASDGPLAVPIDCDPALWSFFVDSNQWEEQVEDEDENSLLEHYQKFTSFGVLIHDGLSECDRDISE
jgi:hypothetical protein